MAVRLSSQCPACLLRRYLTSVCHVQQKEVTGNVCLRVSLLDLGATLSDQHSKLDFVVDFVGVVGVREFKLLRSVGDARPRLEEYHRCFGYVRASHLNHMLQIVLSNTDDLWDYSLQIRLPTHDKQCDIFRPKPHS